MASTRTNGHDTAETLGNEIKSLRQDLSSLMNGLKEAGVSHALQAGDTTHDLVDRAKQRMGRASTVARRRTKVALGEAEKVIADRPALSTAIALGVGVAAGALIQSLWHRS